MVIYDTAGKLGFKGDDVLDDDKDDDDDDDDDMETYFPFLVS